MACCPPLFNENNTSEWLAKDRHKKYTTAVYPGKYANLREQRYEFLRMGIGKRTRGKLKIKNVKLKIGEGKGK